MSSHITAFSVEQSSVYDEEHDIEVAIPDIYEVIVHLDSHHQPPQLSVFQGSESECHQFVERKLRRQEVLKWIGYVVAGLAGSLLTVLALLIQMIFFDKQ